MRAASSGCTNRSVSAGRVATDGKPKSSPPPQGVAAHTPSPQNDSPPGPPVFCPAEPARPTPGRRALEKARDVASRHPGALIIGSDQVALLGDEHLGKPLTHDNAVRQLRAMRGRCVVFYTALALLDARSGEAQTAVAENRVCFRDYSDAEIEAYLRREQPYDCAGSAKSEGLGIILISRMEGNDPNALVGLPLIELTSMLRNAGVALT